MTIVSQPEGSLEMLRVEDLSPLTEIAPQNPSVLDILGFTWSNASVISNEMGDVRESLNKYMPKLLTTFKDTDAVTLISFFGSLIPKLTPEVSSNTNHFRV
jgi:neurochondrin